MRNIEAPDTKSIDEVVVDGLGAYMREVRRQTLLDAASERLVAEQVCVGDAQARDEMAVANLPLVIYIAKQYLGTGLELEELIGAGNLGLVRAVKGFRPEKGFQFSTYAAKCIRTAIFSRLRGEDEPHDSLFEPIDEDEERLLVDEIADESALNPAVVNEDNERRALVEMSLEQLTSREREAMLLLRDEFEIGDEPNYANIARKMGISGTRARSLVMAASYKLRHQQHAVLLRNAIE